MSRFLWICLLMLPVLGWSGCGSSSGPLGQFGTNPPLLPPIATPTISNVTPSSVAAGGPDLSITIDGTNYTAPKFPLSCWAIWTLNQNQTFLLTDFISATELTAIVPANLMTAPGAAQIQVECGDIQGATDGVHYPISTAFQFTLSP